MPQLLNYPRLLYWIRARDDIRRKKEAGLPKPWSDDPVFLTTYFCNVRREDDKVTRFIRKMYSPYCGHRLFDSNIILARFLNWPPTLEYIDYQDRWDPEYMRGLLHGLGKQKVWGSAYVVTTHGIPMDKIDYLCQRVMPSIEDNIVHNYPSRLADHAEKLMRIEGVSTFMAGQIIADLKNTTGHPLSVATDWYSFALPGPGSRRGMDWLCGEKVNTADWYHALASLQDRLYDDGWHLCRQDIQNCLCEYDKYERVSNGTGRSKRSYNGRS